jgi:Ser/Thr protein kinase RdoA (MazF antagonist)
MMENMKYDLQLEKLFNLLDLGEIYCIPTEISGGLLHRMFSVRTRENIYAVKALDPMIMLRPKAMRDIIDSEKIANIAVESVSAVPARIFNGNSVQEMDGQFYLIFDWIDGYSPGQKDIDIRHCEKIGAVLADIHMIDFSGLDIADDNSSKKYMTDWDMYLRKGRETGAVWTEIMSENIDLLYDLNKKLVNADLMLPKNRVISHRDLDPKNVLWNDAGPHIIDWESAGYIYPYHDLVDTAVYWSSVADMKISKEKFIAFADAYGNKCGELKADWDIILDKGFSGLYGWLEYSLKRSLMIECMDETERKAGTVQVKETILTMRQYADTIEELASWLKNDI